MKCFYDPFKEAEDVGIRVQFIDFNGFNSILTKNVIYLRGDMTYVESRCTLAYELIHYNYAIFDKNGYCCDITREEVNRFYQEAANKLVLKNNLYKLLESCKKADEIAEELLITKQMFIKYLEFCKNMIIAQSKENQHCLAA